MGLKSRYVRAVYWLRRPPYGRWIAAGLLVCCGLYLDMRPTPVVSYPFAATPIPVGATVADSLQWREIPTGVLPERHGSVAGVAVTDIASGTPLVPSLTSESVIPPDWWSVSLPLPYRVAPGTRVRVGLEETMVEGIVAGPISDTGFEVNGPIAFPAAQAAQVAAAAGNSALVVMIGPVEPMGGSSG